MSKRWCLLVCAQFNAEELVCGGCTAGKDVNHCKKHGKEFM